MFYVIFWIMLLHVVILAIHWVARGRGQANTMFPKFKSRQVVLSYIAFAVAMIWWILFPNESKSLLDALLYTAFTLFMAAYISWWQQR